MDRVGVVGCGLMGAGIAEVAATSGADVVVVESGAAALTAGRERLAAALLRAERKGRIPDAAAVLARLRFTEDLTELADRQIVIEAIVEDLDAKRALFARLDQIIPGADVVLASNTSSFPIITLAAATGRPERVVGLHFFNPVPVLSLVEVAPSLLTSAETADRATIFIDQTLHKHAIRCQDRAGFVVNALLVPFILSAIRMLEAGVATAEDIDAGMVRGASHPIGPLALADLIGLETIRAVANSLYDEYRDQVYAPPPLLGRLVTAGRLGRKSGRGFFDYRTDVLSAAVGNGVSG